MSLLNPSQTKPVKLHLARNLVRTVKRGHPWIFAEALRRRPKAAPGSRAILLDHKKGREIARGFYDPHSPLAFRVCSLTPGEALDEGWAWNRLEEALALRRILFEADGPDGQEERTTGFRLLNGEGDGLPGLICDVYGDTAVIQLDGPGPAGFWQAQGVAHWAAEALGLAGVYEKRQARAGGAGQPVWGRVPAGPVPFLEHGIRFKADVRQGQKTGFFLDQRANRRWMRAWAAGRRVLNVFGYTGGFSVYAGLGGAASVATVDLAAPALEMAAHHWDLNGLPAGRHETIAADAFAFLTTAAKQGRRWELVILDPPSFASSKAAVPQALKAYQKLIAAGAAVTTPSGLLAAASCSSHIDEAAFSSACQAGLSTARRRATLLGLSGQPADHPTPLAFPEFRYLQFVLLRLDD